MSKRDQSKNTTQNEHIPAKGKPTALGHSGHVLTTYPDYAVWCETDNAFVKENDLIGLPPGK